MPIAISEEHRELGRTVARFLQAHDSVGAARSLLEADEEAPPTWWADFAAMGWLGLAVPEAYGGSGYGLPEAVVVVEEAGRHLMPGPLVASLIVSQVLVAAGDEPLKGLWLPRLAKGAAAGGVALASGASPTGGRLSGRLAAVLSGGQADVIIAPLGEDVAVVDTTARGVDVHTPPNLDPTRRAARVELHDAPFSLLPGAAWRLLGAARLLLAAEAAGVARRCSEQAAAYAKERVQFGRPIGSFQAVKHHCANLFVASEMASALVWDAARPAGSAHESSMTAAMASSFATRAADRNAHLNIQVHGGVGYLWDHDAHLSLRRALAIGATVDAEEAAAAVTDLTRQGVRRVAAVDLPPAADSQRAAVREFASSLVGLDEVARRRAFMESGYGVAHWPRPWGRAAGAAEQLVIEQELARAGVARPSYGITGWVALTLVQHATDEQVERWVRPALAGDTLWCQLFSEPDAGSDAAGITTRATRVDGGWRLAGQKIWTSDAHRADHGLATVRTDPAAGKHAGISAVVVDMHAPGVTVRPLRQATGDADFNEVFLDDVFVPDADVVGPVNGGWTVARATLGNESVSIGGGEGAPAIPAETMIRLLDAHPERLAGGAGRVGQHLASVQAAAVLNLRAAQRAVVGAGPGPDGAISKLVSSENAGEAAAVLAALQGPEGNYTDGDGADIGRFLLFQPAMTIAGGTSEIKRNQIAERLLGLPREPR